MPDSAPTLTAVQRDPTQCHNGHAFTPGLAEGSAYPDPRWCNVCGEPWWWFARMVADAEQRGRAEVSAAVEAVLGEATPLQGGDLDGMVLVEPDQLRAVLADPAAAVARIKAEAGAEALREFARKWADWTAQGSPQIRGSAAYRAICEAQALESADHIGGDA